MITELLLVVLIVTVALKPSKSPERESRVSIDTSKLEAKLERINENLILIEGRLK